MHIVLYKKICNVPLTL